EYPFGSGLVRLFEGIGPVPIRGWWDNLDHEEKSKLKKTISHGHLSKAAFSSIAQTSFIPMQDILGLGSCAMMNTPATEVGNWGWRIPSSTSFDHLQASRPIIISFYINIAKPLGNHGLTVFNGIKLCLLEYSLKNWTC
ncbi:unnamed protein product, partial [Brassica oleracea]